MSAEDTLQLTSGSGRHWHSGTGVVLIALVVLTSCTAAGENRVVSASPNQELRWVDIPHHDSGFGVPAEWSSKTAGTTRFGGLVAATRPRITQNVVHADEDGLGGGVSYVRAERLRPDDAFVSLTFSIWLTGWGVKHHLPSEVGASDFTDSVDQHLGVPFREVIGWRNGDLSVRVRSWIGPDASDDTKSEIEMILERIDLP